MCMTFFCLEDLAAQGLLGNRWNFHHKIGRAYVENINFPEAAVAYDKATIVELAKSLGFSAADVLLPSHQSSLLCKKAQR